MSGGCIGDVIPDCSEEVFVHGNILLHFCKRLASCLGRLSRLADSMGTVDKRDLSWDRGQFVDTVRAVLITAEDVSHIRRVVEEGVVGYIVDGQLDQRFVQIGL